MPRTNDDFAPVYFDEHDNLAQLCADLRSGNVNKINAATAQLQVLPPERVPEILLVLWQKEEPARRKRTIHQDTLVHAAVRGYLVLIGIVLLTVLFLCIRGITFSLVLPVMLLYVAFALLLAVRQPHKGLVSSIQLGAFDVLRKYQTLSLTGLWVDALDFRIGQFSLFQPATPYRPVIYPVLADLLPQIASTDAVPLDDYRQRILLREVQRLTRRLRNSTATLNDSETRFVATVIQYFAAARQEEGTTSLVERLAALSPSYGESVNRRFVREVAVELLPVIQTGRR